MHFLSRSCLNDDDDSFNELKECETQKFDDGTMISANSLNNSSLLYSVLHSPDFCAKDLATWRTR